MFLLLKNLLIKPVILKNIVEVGLVRLFYC